MRHVFVALVNGHASMYRTGEQSPRLSVQFHEELEDGCYADVLRTAVLLDGSAVAVGAKDKPIRIWDLEGELLQEIHPDSIHGALFPVSYADMVLIASRPPFGYLHCMSLSQTLTGSTGHLQPQQ